MKKTFILLMLLVFIGCKNKSGFYFQKKIEQLEISNSKAIEKINITCSDTSAFGYDEAKEIHYLISQLIIHIDDKEICLNFLDSINNFNYNLGYNKRTFDKYLYEYLLLNNFYSAEQKKIELLQLENNFLSQINESQIKAKYCFDYVKALIINNQSKMKMRDGDVYIIVSNKGKSIKGIINGDSLKYSDQDDKILNYDSNTDPNHQSEDGKIFIPQIGTNEKIAIPVKQQ